MLSTGLDVGRYNESTGIWNKLPSTPSYLIKTAVCSRFAYLLRVENNSCRHLTALDWHSAHVEIHAHTHKDNTIKITSLCHGYANVTETFCDVMTDGRNVKVKGYCECVSIE